MWRVLMLLIIADGDSAACIQKTFNKQKIIFNHLAVNYKTGAVYVGAVNRIFELSPDLMVAQKVSTGPVYDSKLCSFDCSGITKESKDNYNKALVIDYAHDRLITCGSVFQGICSVRSLSNIHITRDIPKGVVANDPTASTVVFIAPGPPNPNNTQVMYTGVTFTGSFAHRYHIPAVSSLSLEDHRLFDVAKTFCEFCNSDQVTGTRLYINTMYRDQYIVNYVYGFSSGAFSYFLTTQRSNDEVYHSKIIRICHSDEQYHSYTEIPVSCKQNEYNIVDAGFVTKPGKNLAKELGISTDQDVLYALFHSEKKNYTSKNKVSALCIYTLRDINEKIGANIESCFKGEGMRGLAHVWPDKMCVKHELEIRGADFCGTNVNTPLGGEQPIETRPVAEFNETLTAIAVTSPGNHTVVFVGTTQGHLKKLKVESTTSAVEYSDIVVDEGSPINKDLLLDIQQMHLYVMTEHKVSKVKVDQCNEHKSCSTCVKAGDPYCGWCVIDNKCSSELECNDARVDPLFWLSYNSQCIVIAQVTPVHIQQHSQSVLRTFTDPVSAPSSLFNHLVVDRNTGRVYVGAVNRIYQLSPNLELAQWIATGPVNDSEQCSYDCPNYMKKSMDNVNKALVIDYVTSRLITCGSVLQGLCSVRNLYNISHDVREVDELVVANNATASTVAFIAPGPPNPSMTQVMYVAVTFTGNSPYRSEVPIVSSRSLEDDRLFMIARTGVTTGTRMFLNRYARESYPIKYVYGFSSEGFSYFLTTQLRNVGSEKYYSKLVRVCQYDENYYSYTEIPMSCHGGDSNYNLVQAAFVGKAGSVLAGELGITTQDDVLFAAFSQSESINTNTPSDISALCMYSLKAIRRKFLQNIKSCFSGKGSRGLDFILPPTICIPIRTNFITEDFCGLDVNTPLGGEQPMEAVPVAVFRKRLTAVAATATGDHTVVFAGTAEGHLKKIVVENASFAFEYGDIVVDEGSPINTDLFFDTREMYLYVMTERKISKVKVHQCNEYKTCPTCVSSKDPYCKWCEAEEKCGSRCKSYERNNSQCSFSIRGTIVGRTAMVPLQLTVENMPSGDAELLCVFTLPTITLVMNATRRDYGVNCLTPDSQKLPRAPAGQHEYTAKLSLATINGTEFAATKMTFFACSSYSSCTECTSSPYGCNWDLTDSVCIDAASSTNSMIIANKVSTGQALKLKPMCPQLLAPEQISVPAAVNASISVKVRGIKPNMADKLYCMFKVEGRMMLVEGNFSNDTVRCGDTALDYRSNASVTIASITVAWDGWKLVDNPRGVHLKIYKCAVMASDERSCNVLPETYMCKWNANRKCEYEKIRVNYNDPGKFIDIR